MSKIIEARIPGGFPSRGNRIRNRDTWKQDWTRKIHDALCQSSLNHPGKILILSDNTDFGIFVRVYGSVNTSVKAYGKYAKDGKLYSVRESTKEAAIAHIASRCD